MPSKTIALTDKQLQLLELLFKYRFSSHQTIAASLKLSSLSGIHDRLKVLIKYGMVGKRFEPYMRILGEPAAYYVTPKGIKALQALPGRDTISESTLKSSYRDKVVSKGFISHALACHAVGSALMGHYPGIRIFTKRDMGSYDYFPEQLPDLFLSIPIEDNSPSRYFLDIVSPQELHYQFDTQLKAYLDYFDEGKWDIVDKQLPTLLFVTETAVIERKIRRWIKAAINRWDGHIEILTTNKVALTDEVKTEIWTDIDELEGDVKRLS